MKLNEKTGLYENYGLWHVPFWQTEKFKTVMQASCVLMLFIILLLLIRKYLRYRKKKRLPAWDQALLALTQLKKEHKISAVHGKEFYATVSAILKNYFHDRFAYDLRGKTDTEVIDYIEKYHDDQRIAAEMKTLLQGSEIIKFANAQAAQEYMEHDYIRSIAIIQQTIPQKK